MIRKIKCEKLCYEVGKNGVKSIIHEKDLSNDKLTMYKISTDNDYLFVGMLDHEVTKKCEAI